MRTLILASIAASAFAVAPAGAMGEEEDSPRCLRMTNINSYSVIDREHVVFRGGASRHYLATMRHRCPDLNFGIQIATSFGSNATICHPVVEFITPQNGFRCAIDTIEQVDSMDEARALIAERAEAEAESQE
ncbi:DUF6491 family protein [Hyphobacterium sp.]|uniref:DUF6491 family protein n=1 Tax=Hyphobacterium sp. TaxID=2004662 RepID=UPI003BACC16E